VPSCVDRPGAIEFVLKAIVGTKFRKDRAFGKSLVVDAGGNQKVFGISA